MWLCYNNSLQQIVYSDSSRWISLTLFTLIRTKSCSSHIEGCICLCSDYFRHICEGSLACEEFSLQFEFCHDTSFTRRPPLSCQGDNGNTDHTAVSLLLTCKDTHKLLPSCMKQFCFTVAFQVKIIFKAHNFAQVILYAKNVRNLHLLNVLVHMRNNPMVRWARG